MAQGIPWELFLYQAGSLIFSVAHLAEISRNLGEINKKLDDLVYRFNFRAYSSSYGNYLLLQEISGYLQKYHILTETHRIQLAMIGKDLASDRVYYSKMTRRIDEEIKKNKGQSLRQYMEQEKETIFMDIYGLYFTHRSSILYALLTESADASKKVEEYNQAVEPYGALRKCIYNDEFKTLFLSDKWRDILTTGWAMAWRKDTPQQQREVWLQDFRESLPDMPPITKNIPVKPEIYVIKGEEEFLIYTPTD